MSSSNVARQQFRRLLQKSPKLRKGIQDVKYEVFANLPQLNMRTGHQANKRQLKGVYINQYYLDPIEKSARKVRTRSTVCVPRIWLILRSPEDARRDSQPVMANALHHDILRSRFSHEGSRLTPRCFVTSRCCDL